MAFCAAARGGGERWRQQRQHQERRHTTDSIWNAPEWILPEQRGRRTAVGLFWRRQSLLHCRLDAPFLLDAHWVAALAGGTRNGFPLAKRGSTFATATRGAPCREGTSSGFADRSL